MMQGKTVVITGASSGFGKAMAHSFAKAGASLLLIARRKGLLEELSHQLEKEYGSPVHFLSKDVRDIEAIKKGLDALPEAFKFPELLINNAGMVRGMNKVWETKPHEWDEMIDINVKGVLNLCRLIIPTMLERNSGHIINIGSVSGHDTYAGGAVYCATKYALKAITDTLRKELVATPVRVSMISPGMAETEFSIVRYYGDKKRAAAAYEGFDALTASDIAEIALFIATRPGHVNVADVIVYPTNQAAPGVLHRKG